MKYSLYFLIVLILIMIVYILISSQPTPNNPKIKLNKPNIIVLFTDQERNHQHWPDGWAQKHLPNFERLKKHGLLFHNAFTSASECSPSRAVMVSGQHAPINNVPLTLNAKKGTPLPTYDQLKNVGSVLSNHGYKVIWKGKWHLTLPVDGEYKWTKEDIDVMKNNYKLNGWNPPDAGDAIDNIIKDKSGSYSGLLTLGGGTANNDSRITCGENGVLDELDTIQEPFCLFISLVNPHDVWVYPQFYREAGYFKENFEDIGIELPPNMHDNLSTKPSIQKLAKDSFDKESPITSDKYREYCNFYAYLQTLNDRHIGNILDKLESKQLIQNSIIIRTSDHGEMGMSHGMREKGYVIYDEVINIPLVISNPVLFPNPAETNSLYCHLDLFPTICDLVGVKSNLPGKSIVPILLNPETEVQDNILFKYDDTFFLPDSTPNSHILAIRTKQYTFGVYFSENSSDYEFELYDNVNDKYQLHNLMYNTKLEDSPIATQLYEKMIHKYHEQLKN